MGNLQRAVLSAALTCVWACAPPGEELEQRQSAVTGDYAATRHPIVLMPGLLGFDELLGAIDYFPGIPEALVEGGADVYIVSGSLLGSVSTRAAQIIPQLEEIEAIAGATKLNLIAHSQGALDARLIAAMRPDLVASVTSIGGPHAGALLAQLVVHPVVGALPAAALGVLGELMRLVTGSDLPNDVHAAMEGLTPAGVAAFNARVPAALPATPCGEGAPVVDGIHYYSWSGVGSLTNPLDPLDAFWVLSSLISREPNDGLVGRCSSHLGRVIRDDYFHNHIDETGMLFGLVFPLGASPTALFRSHANRLQRAGL